MRMLPVSLRLDGRRCAVVGGDEAAAAKAAACARAGAEVVIVAADLSALAARLVAEGGATHVPRAYRDGDLAGALLAYASTRDPELIAALVAEAGRERVLLNVIDVPEACTFTSPAVVERGDLTVAVATGGASPGLAARLRRDLDGRIGPEYGPFVAILGGVRRLLTGQPGRVDVVNALLDSPLLELVRRHDRVAIDALLADVAGPGCDLDGLGVWIGPAEAA